MEALQYVTLVRVSWLVLSGMMLFSRFVFQAAGSVWMRSFLDKWKYSLTHRVWGWVAFVFGITLLIGMISVWDEINHMDRLLATFLIFVLSADGLLNLFPSWFGHFKERMQDTWIKKYGATKKAGDKNLFGIVNFFLGLASLAAAVFVAVYKPLQSYWIGVSATIAIMLMTILIIACKSERAKTVLPKS